MAIRKPATKRTQNLTSQPSEDDIDQFIEGGSPPVPDKKEPIPKADIKFQMVIPGDLCQIIDLSRKFSRTSRRAWLLQAAEEKLKKDGLI